jgi:hypothetical protein
MHDARLQSFSYDIRRSKVCVEIVCAWPLPNDTEQQMALNFEFNLVTHLQCRCLGELEFSASEPTILATEIETLHEVIERSNEIEAYAHHSLVMWLDHGIEIQIVFHQAELHPRDFAVLTLLGINVASSQEPKTESSAVISNSA